MTAQLELRVLVVVGLAACGAGTTPPQSGARATPCLDRAAAETEAAAARDRNRTAFLAALEHRGLTLEAIEPQVEPAGDGVTEWRVANGIAWAPVSYRACGELPGYELARDGDGGLWALLPAPAVSGRRDLHACGCYGEEPITCGGAAPEPVLLGYRVPDGLTFRGTAEIGYPHEDVSVFLVGHSEPSARRITAEMRPILFACAMITLSCGGAPRSSEPPSPPVPASAPAPAPAPATAAAPRPARDRACDRVRRRVIDGRVVALPMDIVQVYCSTHGDGCCAGGGATGNALGGTGGWQWNCNNDRSGEWYRSACLGRR